MITPPFTGNFDTIYLERFQVVKTIMVLSNGGVPGTLKGEMSFSKVLNHYTKKGKKFSHPVPDRFRCLVISASPKPLLPPRLLKISGLN